MSQRQATSYPLNAAGTRIDENGNKFIRVKGVRWFTNIEHGHRHEPLQLMTMDDNIRFSKHKEVRGFGYPEYDNHAAIEVGFTEAIPRDYPNAMGVPLTFLDKYNPDQFEILGMGDRSNSSGLRTRVYTSADAPKHNDLNRTCAYLLPDGTLKGTYDRILIRHRNPAPKKG